jgi:hypothetical protein
VIAVVVNLLQKRLEEIRTELKGGDLDKAAGLLVTTLASDELFAYWTTCCDGVERIPKILRYIKRISFSNSIPTARINILEGFIEMSPQFFIEQIITPPDCLMLCIHERNHLLLHRLYPHLDLPADYPRHLLAFAEDAYINGLSRRHLPSTLPERFYGQPVEMLLTGMHSKIDWDYFSLERFRGQNRLRLAHQTLYCRNQKLLAVLGERIALSNALGGYEEWMRLLYEWHRVRSRKEAEAKRRTHPMSPPSDATSGEEGSGEGVGRCPKDQTESGTSEKPSDNDPEKKGGAPEDGTPGQDKEGRKKDSPERPERAGKPGTEAVDRAIERVIPLVQNDSDGPGAGRGRKEEAVALNGIQVTKIRLPDLLPGDPIVRMILTTCEIPALREPVEALDDRLWGQVDSFVRGILSERVLEKECVGHSAGIPFPMTRRDVFLLSVGETPILCQKKIGFEKPWIDLYVDVSGSMRRYYPYIPFIYEALKPYFGTVYQFSTVILKVEPREPFLFTTGGTCFNTVAAHMIEKGNRWAILVSDGRCDLDHGLMKKLEEQLEHFTYIKVNHNLKRNWELIADQLVTLY